MLLLMPALLLAQRPPASPADAFNRELKRNRFGTWLVLEDEGAAWGGTMRSALDEEPMVLLNLPLKVVAGGRKADALAATLRERFGWSKGARWALVDANGRVRAEGAEAPTPSALGRAADQAGLSSRAQELEAFLRQNPDRLDARAALIQIHLAVANRRTRKALGVTEAKPEVKPGETPGPTPVKPLAPEADLAIWAAAAHQLDLILRETGGSYLGGAQGFMLSMWIRRSAAEHSLSMVAVLNRHRGALEETLRRQPENSEVWQLWIVASQKCGGWPLQPLLATIAPMPGTSAGQWPPWSILEEYLKDAKSRGEWATIREVLEPRWAEFRDSMLDGRGNMGSEAFPWDWILGPLVEAQVSQGDIGAADQVLSEAAEVISWPGLPAKARDLAMRLKRPDLAARWGALTPKGR
jgi:hypothetical protein